MKKTELNDLPTEILVNILSRPPITSLLQHAKYTCKLWHYIIKDPLFAELQWAQSLTSPGHLYAFTRDSNLYFVDKSLGDTTVGIMLPAERKKIRCMEFFSCRGLICYRNWLEKSAFVCNPIISDHVKIPSKKEDNVITFGFGYALLSKKYKYVQFSYEREENLRMEGTISTLGEESWRHLDVHPFTNCWWKSPVYFNGFLYFPVEADSDSELHVVCLNLDSEKICAKRVCSPFTISFNSKWHLTVLGETVASVFWLCEENFLEIWIMVDEDRDVWVQKYHIHVPVPEMGYADLKLSGLWMNQTWYFMAKCGREDEWYSRRCLLFCKDTYTLTNLKLPFAKNTVEPQIVIPHAGSLVSPSMIVAAAMQQPTWITREDYERCVGSAI